MLWISINLWTNIRARRPIEDKHHLAIITFYSQNYISKYWHSLASSTRNDEQSNNCSLHFFRLHTTRSSICTRLIFLLLLLLLTYIPFHIDSILKRHNRDTIYRKYTHRHQMIDAHTQMIFLCHCQQISNNICTFRLQQKLMIWLISDLFYNTHYWGKNNFDVW